MCAGIFWGYTALGTGIGAAIGVLMNLDKDRDLLYKAPRRTTTVTVSPLLSPTRKGLAVSVSWR